MPPQLEIVRHHRALEALAPAWDRVPQAMECPTLSHAWFLSCARTLHAEDDLHVIAACEQGVLTGVVPLVIRRHAGIARLELIGVSTLYEPSGMLYDSDDTLDVLLRAVLNARKPALLSRVPLRASIVSRMRALAGGRGVVMSGGGAGTLAVPITGDWNQYLAQLSSQRRYDLRRARRRAEEAGRVTVRVLHPGPDDVEGVFAEFVRIESAGWKARNGSSLSQRRDLRAFFLDYARQAAASGILRVSFLDVGATTVAAQLSVEYAKRLWVLKIGYDEAWSRCSPGWQLLAETMRDAFEQGLKSYEFLGSDEAWLHGWTADAREFGTVAWYPATPLGMYGLAADTTERVRARLASSLGRQ